ncbi:MAG: hypothetical protein WDM71_05610 [Ferruginibacter sp.]
MKNLTQQQKIYYALRLASAMCFIGHGAFGIITKPIWVNYFDVFGIGHDTAYHLMPVVGSIDILCGLILLFYPVRAVVVWLVIWGFVTATLRPLSGEPFAELIERAGNFGAPLALLLLTGGVGKNIKDFFKPVIPPVQVDEKTFANIKVLLRAVVFLLLVGHGWLNLIGKKALLSEYTSLGFSNSTAVAQAVGLFEIMVGLAVLVRPFRPLLIGLFIWKMASELFYPHYEIFEWIERGGSYFALLSLWLAIDKTTSSKTEFAFTIL